MEIRSKFQALELAKICVAEDYFAPDRKWIVTYLETSPQDTDGLELHGRPGSPYKGYIIVNKSSNKVIAYSNHDKKLGVWVYSDQNKSEESVICDLCQEDEFQRMKGRCSICKLRQRKQDYDRLH